MRKNTILIPAIILTVSMLFVHICYTQTINIDPYGRAVPRLYDVTTYGDSTTLGAYYLDFPTLSGNDTLSAIGLTETLTNKTLTTPTITNPTVSTGTFTTPTITNPTVSTGSFTTPHMEDPNMGGVVSFTGDTGTMKLAVYQSDNVIDDATADIFPNAVDGIVFGMCNPDSTHDRVGVWVVGADGTVLIAVDIPSSSNDDASTDGDLCLYQQGTGTVMANRVDSTADVRFFMFYQ